MPDTPLDMLVVRDTHRLRRTCRRGLGACPSWPDWCAPLAVRPLDRTRSLTLGGWGEGICLWLLRAASVPGGNWSGQRPTISTTLANMGCRK